jgi:sugar/nucleoside kinase (ribokinase family)
VSTGTVSHVLNGTASVRPDTRDRVEAAIRELSFRPNALARSLIARARPTDQTLSDAAAPRLITVGYTSVDYTARINVLPHRDDRVTALGIEKSLGGPAANVAVVAAGLADRFPVAVELVTAIGDDADSDWALAELSFKHVDTIAIRRRPGQRLSRCIVLVEPNGSRTIINEPFELQESDLARYLGQSTPGARRCLHIEGFQIPRMLDSMLTIGRSGWLTSLQTTGLPQYWRASARLAQLIAQFDLVFLNRDVAREATDCRGGSKQLIEATLALVAGTPAKGTVILTLGEDGALLLPPDGTPIAVPAPQIDVVDTTGAGDAFAGAFLAVWLGTGDATLAARYGTAAGSLIVSVEGAQGANPSAANLEALMAGPVSPASAMA